MLNYFKNKIDINKLILSSSTILTSFFNFIFILLLTRIMSPSEYGKLNLLLIYSTILSIVFLNGVDQAIIRFFYTKSFKSILKNFFIIFFVENLIMLILITILNQFNHDIQFWLLIYLYTNALVMFRIVSVTIRMINKASMYGLYNVGSKIIETFFILGFYFINFLNYKTAIVAYVSAILIISSIMTLLLYRRKSFFENSEEIDFNRQIKYAIPLIISILLTVTSQNLDKIILSININPKDLGIYISAFKLTGTLMILQSIFSLIWIPDIIKKYEMKLDINFQIKKSIIIYQTLLISFGILLSLSSSMITKLLGSNYSSATDLLPILFLIPVFNIFSEIGAIGISLKEKNQYHIVSALVLILSTVIMMLSFPQFFGIKGAALASGLSAYLYYLVRNYMGLLQLNIRRVFISTELINLTYIIFTISLIYIDTLFIKSMVLFILIILIVKRLLQWRKHENISPDNSIS